MKRWKLFLAAAITLVVTAVVFGLSSLAASARQRGVERVPVPRATLIAGTLVDADYADAYAVSVPPRLFRDAEALSQYAFQKTERAAQTENEVMYGGGSSSLTYHVSYLLTKRDASGATVTVSTTVRYENWRGRAYFTVVRPFHRVLTPYLVGRMVERATSEAAVTPAPS